MTCVMNICDDLFAGCSGITTLTLPNSITAIGSRAFLGEYKGGIHGLKGESVMEVTWIEGDWGGWP